MNAPDHGPPTKILRGRSAMEEVPTIVDGRAFLVTDRGIAEAGHAGRLQRALEAAGVEVSRYDEARPNPGEDDVAACHDAYERARRGGAIDWIVALGGGSAIDVAKGCAMLACGGGRMASCKRVTSAAHMAPRGPPAARSSRWAMRSGRSVGMARASK